MIFVYIQIGIVVFTQAPIPVRCIWIAVKTLDEILRTDFELRVEVQFVRLRDLCIHYIF